jgi:hypothetical protein
VACAESIVDVAWSVNRVPIRLTDERWSHIVNAHDEAAAGRAVTPDTRGRPRRFRTIWDAAAWVRQHHPDIDLDRPPPLRR